MSRLGHTLGLWRIYVRDPGFRPCDCRARLRLDGTQQAADVEARLAKLEAGAPVRTTVVSDEAQPEATLAPTIAPEAEPERVEEAPIEALTQPPLPEEPAPAAEAARPRPASPGLEERLGTRWVVWVGGLTLALGGLFLVRYSIEAGLLGPAARVFFGGLFAAGLLAAGEWTRRKESISTHRHAADRQHSGDPHGRRYRGCFRHRICQLRAIRLSRTRHGLRRAGSCRARDACRSAAAWTCARGPRRGRRIRHARAGRLRQAGLLGALRLYRHRHRGSVRPRPHPHVALARHHHHRARRAVVAGGNGPARPALAARVQHHRGICAGRHAGRVRLPVRSGG